MTDYAWVPTPEAVEHANVTRFMCAHGAESIDALRARSVADVDWFWDAVIADLGLPFTRPYTAVRDSSRGIEWTTWFSDGGFNAAAACVERWRGPEPAIIHEAETGEVRTLSYEELWAEVTRVAAGLRSLGVGRGDVVALYMPMVPEAAVALYATAAVGAVALPLFSGFAAGAIAARLRDARAKVVFTADGTWRRGKHALLKPVLEEAVAACDCVEHVITLGRLDRENDDYAALDGEFRLADTDAEAPLLIGYTSGTSGKPKGAVLTQAGFVVKVAMEVAYEFDLHRGDVFTWITDMGWIMGPLSVMGVHANGGTLLLYEGAPDTPSADRVWRVVERHPPGGAARRAPPPGRARRLADADPRAEGGGPAAVRHRPGLPADLRRVGRAVGRGRLPLARTDGGGGQAPGDQLLRRDRGGRRVPRALPGRAAQGVLARRALAGHGRGRLRPAGPPAARRRRRAGLPAAVAGDDAWRVSRPR